MTNRNGKKGAGFERVMADWFKEQWSRYIDRKVKTGAHDTGDIANFYIHMHNVVIECKSLKGYDLAGAVKEAEQEAINAGALAGIAVIKRHGKGQPQDQFIVMTADVLVKLLKAAIEPSWHPTDETLYGRWCPGDQSRGPRESNSPAAQGGA